MTFTLSHSGNIFEIRLMRPLYSVSEEKLPRWTFVSFIYSIKSSISMTAAFFVVKIALIASVIL